jgi:hypothetical protein
MIKIDRLLLLVLFIAAFSVAAYSLTKTTQVTDDISLDEIKDCHNVTWNDPKPWFGNCTRVYNETICLEGEETAPDGVSTFFNSSIEKECYLDEKETAYRCKVGEISDWQSKQVCKEKEFKLTVDDGLSEKEYSINYEGWGKCSYDVEGETVVITCDSRFDGNNDGICTSGESCMQYRVTKGSIQTLMKNSRDDFVESDDSFFLEKLKVEEVG